MWKLVIVGSFSVVMVFVKWGIGSFIWKRLLPPVDEKGVLGRVLPAPLIRPPLELGSVGVATSGVAEMAAGVSTAAAILEATPSSWLPFSVLIVRAIITYFMFDRMHPSSRKNKPSCGRDSKRVRLPW